MPDSSARTFSQEINTWMQTVVLLAAFIWGISTFYIKEVVMPKAVPVNISVNLQLKPIGTGPVIRQDQGPRLVAVEMKASASNPSTREVALLPNVWIAYGIKTIFYKNEAWFYEYASDILRSGRNQSVQRHSSGASAPPVVATGVLFPDVSLKPNEAVATSTIIHVPDGEYDVLEVQVVMPSARTRKGIELIWALAEDGTLKPQMSWVAVNGERRPMKQDKEGAYYDARLELQMARTVSQISLWRPSNELVVPNPPLIKQSKKGISSTDSP